MQYREPEPYYVDVYDWDILIFSGHLKVCGLVIGHTDRCPRNGGSGYQCLCDNPILSSPIVGENRRVLTEGCYEVETGDGRALLEKGDGSVLEVKSEKTYRLNGPRVPSEKWHAASIWTVYSAEDVPRGFWHKLRFWKHNERCLWGGV